MDFSAEVRSEIARRNLNKNELAKQIGISRSYLYELLKGKRRWNDELIVATCEVLDLKIVIRKNKI